jgi:hypothetical protein
MLTISSLAKVDRVTQMNNIAVFGSAGIYRYFLHFESETDHSYKASKRDATNDPVPREIR